MDYILHAAVAQDREWLWRTKCDCLRPYVEQTFGGWNEAEQRARFVTNFDTAEVRLIAAAGRDVGYVSARPSPEELRLFNIMIAPEFQNRGLGTAVLRQLQTEAKALGVPLRLQVLKVNPARRLYARLGFTTVEETATHVRMLWRPA